MGISDIATTSDVQLDRALRTQLQNNWWSKTDTHGQTDRWTSYINFPYYCRQPIKALLCHSYAGVR